MTDLLQTGGFSRAQTTLKPQQLVSNPPQWRYLWLLADVGNQAALNVWIGTPPNNRAPDLVLGPGQQREQDLGAIVARSWWITSVDGSSWAAQYAMDVERIGTDANVVGATTPLQPARVLGTYQTTNNVATVDGPYQVPAGCQSIMVLYPQESLGMGNGQTAVLGDQSGAEGVLFPPNARLAPWQAAVIFPSGAGDTSFHIRHDDSDPFPETVQVIALFTPVVTNPQVSQGPGAAADGSWVVSVEGGPISVQPQAGAVFPVSQSGAWAVAATQSGAWLVGQSGGWSVGQSGAPWSVIAGAVVTANILGGSVASVNGGPATIITIPANRTWRGTVGCTATAGVVAAIKAGNGTGSSTPSAGTLLAQTDTGAPAVASDIYVAAQTGTATITLSTSGANGDGWANGVLL